MCFMLLKIIPTPRRLNPRRINSYHFMNTYDQISSLFFSRLFSAFGASGVALWEASFVLAEWLSRHGDKAGGLTNCQAYQDNLQGYGLPIVHGLSSFRVFCVRWVSQELASRSNSMTKGAHCEMVGVPHWNRNCLSHVVIRLSSKNPAKILGMTLEDLMKDVSPKAARLFYGPFLLWLLHWACRFVSWVVQVSKTRREFGEVEAEFKNLGLSSKIL